MQKKMGGWAILMVLALPSAQSAIESGLGMNKKAQGGRPSP